MADFGNSTVFTQSDAGNGSGTMPSWNGSAAPSTLDDAGRALQGAVTREWNWRNYTLTAGGTANAKTLTYSVAPEAYRNGQLFAFVANTTNTASATLNVNVLGAKTIKKDSSGTLANLAASDMVAGMRVQVAYDSANDCFVWVNQKPFPSNASETAAGIVELATEAETIAGTDTERAVTPSGLRAYLPVGSIVPYAGSTAPNGWLFCFGQNASRTTNAALFDVIGTIYGEGNGTTTFTLPDLRGRVIAGREDMGGTNANRLSVTLSGLTTAGSAVVTGLSSTSGLAVGMRAISDNIPSGRTIASIDSATQITLNSGTSVTAGAASIRFSIVDGPTLGASGGTDTHTLITDELPAHRHFVAADAVAGAGATVTASNQVAVVRDNGTGSANYDFAGTSTAATLGRTSLTGGGNAHPNVQPTFILNYIIKT